MLTWDMVKEMAKNNISFECHTVNHEFLDELSLEDMIQEAVPARDRIKEMTGQPGDILACPNGNIPSDKIDALKKEFIANCITCIGFNKINADLYGLKRKDANYFQLDQGFHEEYFALEMSGILDRPRQIKGWLDSRIRGFFTGNNLL